MPRPIRIKLPDNSDSLLSIAIALRAAFREAGTARASPWRRSLLDLQAWCLCPPSRAGRMEDEWLARCNLQNRKPSIRRDSGNLISEMSFPECDSLGVSRLRSVSRETAKATFFAADRHAIRHKLFLGIGASRDARGRCDLGSGTTSNGDSRASTYSDTVTAEGSGFGSLHVAMLTASSRRLLEMSEVRRILASIEPAILGHPNNICRWSAGSPTRTSQPSTRRRRRTSVACVARSSGCRDHTRSR
jgi:hypothetical protein